MIQSLLLALMLLPIFVFAQEKPDSPRYFDPVILPFEKIPAFLHLESERIRTYRWNGKKLEPIPFQIDQKDAAGNYHFPKDKKNANTSSQVLIDPQDELVVMARDLGNPLALPAKKNAKIGSVFYEIMEQVAVYDPVRKSAQYLYLALEKVPSEKSKRSYISYDATKRLTQTAYYELQGENVPITFSHLRIRDQNGELSARLLDRVKARFQVKLFSFFNINYSEENFKNQLIWHKLGPVRLVQVNQVTPVLIAGIEMPSAIVNSYYYLNFYSDDVVVELPFSPTHFCSKADFLIYFDYLASFQEMNIFVKNVSEPLLLADGKSSIEEKNLSPKIAYLWSAIQDKKSGVSVLAMATKYKELESITPSPYLYYRDDLSEADDPEEEKGCFGCLGFRVDTLPLKKGTYKFHVHFFFLPDFKPGMEEGYQELVQEPLILP